MATLLSTNAYGEPEDPRGMHQRDYERAAEHVRRTRSRAAKKGWRKRRADAFFWAKLLRDLAELLMDCASAESALPRNTDFALWRLRSVHARLSEMRMRIATAEVLE